jgi:hypothetical protein
MASEILGLFTTPQQYQQQQQDVARARAMEYARLDPFQQASAAIGQGAYGLAGAIGGALGGQDPQLQKITQRQQLLGMIDPANPDSYGQAIQAALQTGDQEAAFLLRNEMMKVKEQAQNQQLNELKTQDYLTQRGQGMQAAGLTNFANELVGQLKNPDGTINEEVKTKLLSFPQGRAAISEQAKVLPDLRKLGAAGTPEVNPFDLFVNDPTIPAALKTTAQQYKNSFNKGIYSEEQTDKLVANLATAAQRSSEFQQTQTRLDQNSQIMNDLKRQGLETSQQYLALAQQQAGLNNTLKAQKIEQDAEIARNKPLPVQLQRDESKDLELVDSLTARATSLLPAINSLTVDPKTKKAPLELGPVNNLRYLGQNAAGKSTVESRAYAQLQRSVQEATNLKTDAAKGVQTDKDVLRFANELIAAFGANDTQTSLDALNNFYKSTVKAEENTKRRIDSRRTSQGVQPYYGPTAGTAKNPIKLD